MCFVYFWLYASKVPCMRFLVSIVFFLWKLILKSSDKTIIYQETGQLDVGFLLSFYSFELKIQLFERELLIRGNYWWGKGNLMVVGFIVLIWICFLSGRHTDDSPLCLRRTGWARWCFIQRRVSNFATCVYRILDLIHFRLYFYLFLNRFLWLFDVTCQISVSVSILFRFRCRLEFNVTFARFKYH